MVTSFQPCIEQLQYDKTVDNQSLVKVEVALKRTTVHPDETVETITKGLELYHGGQPADRTFTRQNISGSHPNNALEHGVADILLHRLPTLEKVTFSNNGGMFNLCFRTPPTRQSTTVHVEKLIEHGVLQDKILDAVASRMSIRSCL